MLYYGKSVVFVIAFLIVMTFTNQMNIYSLIYRKSSGNLSRGNSNDSDAYGTPPGTDDRRTVHIQIGGTSDNSRRSSNTGADSFQQVYQTQLPAYQETSYYTSQPTTSFNTPVDCCADVVRPLNLLS